MATEKRILSNILKKADKANTIFELLSVQSELQHYSNDLKIIEMEFAVEHIQELAEKIKAKGYIEPGWEVGNNFTQS